MQHDDKYQSLLLLCSLSKTHDHLKKTLLYGRETFSVEEVQVAMSFKELNEKFDSSAKNDLVARGLLVITNEVGCQSLRCEMVEIHHPLDVTIVRRKVTPKGFIQRGRKRLKTLIDYLSLVNDLTDCLHLVKQLCWKTIMNHERSLWCRVILMIPGVYKT